MEIHVPVLKEWGKVRLREPMAKHTTFKIGGIADLFLTVTEKASFLEAVRYLTGEGVPFVVVGGGSNMLFGDDEYHGVVIQVAFKEKRVEGTHVIADAGCATVEIAQFSIQNKLTGFEWGVGVPGTIGGAVRGNAGAMGGEMRDTVSTVDVWRDGEVVTLSKEECGFSYRGSAIKTSNDIVLSVVLALSPSVDVAPMKKALEHLAYRNKTQPQGWASTGCIFKNVDLEKNREHLLAHFSDTDEKVMQFLRVGKISAGWLIEQSGLKGRQIGQAQVSETHGNFVVNLGGASATDVSALIDEIKETVYNRFSIELEEEIQRIN